MEECTSVINETMINNKDNIENGNTITNIFIILFSVLLFVGIVCSCVFVNFKLKVKNYSKINMLIIEHIKNGYKAIKNKNQS